MAADCLLILDPQGYIVDINETGCLQRGYQREEMLGRHISEFDPPEFAPLVPQRMQQLFQQGQGLFQSAHICKDGSILPVEINARLILLDGERFVFSVIRDIRQQQSMQQAIHASQMALGEQLIKLRAFLQNNPLGIHSYQLHDNGQLEFIGANGAADRILGFSHQPLIGLSVESAFPALRNTPIPAAFRQVAKEGGSWEAEQFKYADHGIDGIFSIHAFQTAPGQVSVFFDDVTQARRQEESLRLAATVFENACEAIMIVDAHNQILTVNPAFTQTTGYLPAEVIGQTPSLLKSGRQSAAFYQQMWQTLCDTGKWQGEIWNRRKNGEIFPEYLSIYTLYTPKGEIFRRIASFLDISDKKASDELIWRQANYDNLTDLPNRQLLYSRLEETITRASERRNEFCLLIIDIDRFREVNDTFGHQAGDTLLIAVGKRLAEYAQNGDCAARLSGNQFALLLSHPPDQPDLDTFTLILQEQLAHSYAWEETHIYATVSIGVAVFPNDSRELAQLVQYAEQAMYTAKNQGGNRTCHFTADLQAAVQDKARLTTELRHAVAHMQFQVYFQPVVELRNGHIHKAEALLRWNHPTHGIISPVSFIPLAEDTGLIVGLGEWVFQQAIQGLRHWKTLCGGQFQISVNKSPVQFRSDDGAQISWPTYLEQLGLQGQDLVIEITEGMLLNQDEQTSQKLRQFHDAGIQFSIDDFGTGYSSLSYLKRLNIDYLKIDQSFVRNMCNDPTDLALCEAIVMMAHKLDLKVIAEGVETAAQRDLLRQIGCDYGQGFFFSRPLPRENFEQLLQQQAEKTAQ